MHYVIAAYMHVLCYGLIGNMMMMHVRLVTSIVLSVGCATGVTMTDASFIDTIRD
jgi:hypothetical protein